jgi:hypothetical protein
MEICKYDYQDDSGKQAIIVEQDGGYFVKIRDRAGNIEKTIDVSQHSIYYAQDTAVNYATGIAV